MLTFKQKHEYQMLIDMLAHLRAAETTANATVNTLAAEMARCLSVAKELEPLPESDEKRVAVAQWKGLYRAASEQRVEALRHAEEIRKQCELLEKEVDDLVHKMTYES